MGVSRDDFQNVSCLHPENSSAAVSFFLDMYRHSCQIMLRRLFNWYVTFFRKNILSFCIFSIGFHIFVKLHSSAFRNLLPTILQDIYVSNFWSGQNWYPLNFSSLLFWSEFCSHYKRIHCLSAFSGRKSWNVKDTAFSCFTFLVRKAVELFKLWSEVGPESGCCQIWK